MKFKIIRSAADYIWGERLELSRMRIWDSSYQNYSLEVSGRCSTFEESQNAWRKKHIKGILVAYHHGVYIVYIVYNGNRTSASASDQQNS